MPEASTAQQIFEEMPRYFASEAAAGVNVSIQFELSGEAGGEWSVVIADQSLKVSQGRIESPTLTVRSTAADWVAMANRKLNPMAAFMQGRLVISGSLSLAMKLQDLFRRPE